MDELVHHGMQKLEGYVERLNKRELGARVWHIARGPYRAAPYSWVRARLESNDGRRRRMLWEGYWHLVDGRRGEV